MSYSEGNVTFYMNETEWIVVSLNYVLFLQAAV